MKIYIYVFLPSYTRSEEDDGSPTSTLGRKIGYMCRIYNDYLNGSIHDDS